MLDVIQATSLDTISRVHQIRLELERAAEKARASLPRIYTKELVETLFVHPCSKIEFLVKALKVERKAASRYLQSLEEIGLLEGQKVEKQRIYVNVGMTASWPGTPAS